MTPIDILDITEAYLIYAEVLINGFIYAIFQQLEIFVGVVASHPRTFLNLMNTICVLYYLYMTSAKQEPDEEKENDHFEKIVELLEMAKQRNVLINIVTLGLVTHQSARSNRRYVSDFDLSITYYSSLEDQEKNKRHHKIFKIVQKQLSNQNN